LHELAIGDFSAASGGFISEHHSHQSGRDVDIGLFYKTKPDGYPEAFVEADAKTLDARAMWRLISKLDKTRDDDGGVLMMFLDFELQGVIYKWAKANGVDEDRLDRIFQWPHGRGSSAGVVRHEPNHGNHIHVRFRCAEADVQCR
jgi:murein endopeptidase